MCHLASADKLAETKRAEREARLATQREHQAAKDKREAQRLAEAATARDLRAFHGNSKRHQKEVKEVCSRLRIAQFWSGPLRLKEAEQTTKHIALRFSSLASTDDICHSCYNAQWGWTTMPLERTAGSPA